MAHRSAPARRFGPPAWPRGAATAAALLAFALVAASCGDDDRLAASPSGATTVNGAVTTNAAGAGSPADTTSGPGAATSAADDGGTPAPAPAAIPFDELELALTPVVTVNQPIALTQYPGSADLYLAERGGRVRRVVRTVDQARGVERIKLLTEPVLDLSDQLTTEGEGGLLGLTFAPDGTSLYVHFTDVRGDTAVAAYPVTPGTDGGAVVDAASPRPLIAVDQPYANHNGGDLLFGPDGMLYITLGDGGGGGDPEETGQDPTDQLGSILRIDPRPAGTAPYTIPPDNPFADGADGAPEVWLWGARNPWRVSFDAATGDLWVADVGQNAIEEIDHLPAAGGAGRGANLGWNLMEGNESFAGDPPVDHVDPIHTYGHDNGRCSVTGGYVYRGPTLGDLHGVYVFGDYCSGEVFGLEGAATGAPRAAPLNLDRGAASLISFGQDTDGEIYVLQQGGQVSRLTSRTGTTPIEILSDAG